MPKTLGASKLRKKKLVKTPVRFGDTGAIEEGRAAALMIGATKFSDGRLVNPYARALKHLDRNGEARGRYIELRNSWNSGFASVPKSKRGTAQ